MLKSGMRGNMRRDHRRVLGRGILVRLLRFVWSRGSLVFLVVIVAFSRKVFGSFVLMGRAKLEKHGSQHEHSTLDGQETNILIAAQSFIHVTR